MTVRIEKNGKVWTIVHARPEARNAMDPESADALGDAFVAFDRDADAAVAVLWGEGGAFCAGWDLKYGATMADDPKALDPITYSARRPGNRQRSASARAARSDASRASKAGARFDDL